MMKQTGYRSHIRIQATLNRQSGVILLLVLWVLVLLSVVAAEFCRVMRSEANISVNHRELTHAYYTAIGGLNLAIDQILTRGAATDSETKQTENREQIKWRVNADIPAFALGNGIVKVSIDNEGGKVNINMADELLLRMLVGRLEIPAQERKIIVESILDWRDTDSFHRLNGAENAYYASMPVPYFCKNGDFDSVEELLLVRGMTPEIFKKGFAGLVTVYPSRKKAEMQLGWKEATEMALKDFDFSKICLNAAPRELLMALPSFTPETVDAILEWRQTEDFKTYGDFINVVGYNTFLATMNYVTLAWSPYYRITASGVAESGHARRTVGAVVRIDLKSDEKYHIVQWFDNMTDTASEIQKSGQAAARTEQP